ncbi:hypothetical protein BKA56DRAFT_562252 [Ilyonectria sp. MPI-CAGE-AT-0026]|nr:hypothetical protein BKA56DRAFT_562252 [Ilyonectria sp. MPI-CAGE-AT-0026]
MHFRIWFLCLLLLCLCVAAADDDSTCSATKSCKNGCCNKSGNCGFGPDYCGTNCRSDCGRKSECNPGFDSKWAARDKCPLNVCCSKHGFCGTTKDFCGSKKVTRPSCDKDNGIPRVVGYFEGWAQNRPCEAFWPEQIPIGLYTHINFAFATINPLTFLVHAAEDADIKIYKRLMALKKKDPDLKIYLALGGWTFNDPGATNTTFFILAGSFQRQKVFMSSLMSFMSTHGFDGLDLDWEYPQAKDRAGRDADFANFPEFMASLKKMMDGGDKGRTITLPASYWYLQHFDIKKLVRSYDLHGAWDQKVNWTQPYLNAHTNLTEIDLALDLLWRNDIEYSKVVLGLGFYGRAFTAATSSCMKPGCLFKAPGDEGKCSREKGILLNSEIDAVIKERSLKPELYKEAAVKVARWKSQWVSFDDEETLKMKTEFAQSRCLGGIMVWAISHDTKDAKYNKALAQALNRKVTSGSIDDDEKASDINKIPNEQCRWTNCKEDCPKGWVNVARSDGGARTKKDERMWDETGCGGDGHHSFCCPGKQKQPTCGCMKVYGTCEWGAYPDCDGQEKCPNPTGDSSKNYIWAGSSSGSGGGQCDDKKNGLGLKVPGTQLRKFCCDVANPNLRFTDCQWFKDVGPAPDSNPNGFCRSGCPADRVRVAIDTDAALALRDDVKIHDITAQLLLTYILARIGSENMLEEMGGIWDSYIEENFPYLTRRAIKAFLGITPQWELDGPEETARRILCSPHSYNARVAAIQGTNGGGKAKWINCTYSVCDQNGVCKEAEDKETRRRRALLPSRSTNLYAHHHHLLHVRQLSKPAESQAELVSPEGDEVAFEYEVPAVSAAHPISSDRRLTLFYQHNAPVRFDPGHSIEPAEHPIEKTIMKQFFLDAAMGTLWSGAKSLYGPIAIEFFEEILVLGADSDMWPKIPGNPDFDNRNLFSRMMECLGSQTNDINFVITTSDLNQVKGKVRTSSKYPGQQGNLMDRQEPVAERGRKDKIKDDIDYVLGVLRACVAMFEYMNSDTSPGPNVFGKTSNIINDILHQLSHAELLWQRKHPDNHVAIGQFFLEWLRDYYGFVTAHAKKFLRETTSEAEAYWKQQTSEQAMQVRETLFWLNFRLDDLHIRTDWVTPIFEDDDPMDTSR